MILERTNTEILVRLPSTVDLSELQDMLDYLRYKELTPSANASQSDVDDLSKIINKSMWSNLKEKRKLK